MDVYGDVHQSETTWHSWWPARSEVAAKRSKTVCLKAPLPGKASARLPHLREVPCHWAQLAGVWSTILIAKTNGLCGLRSPLPVVGIAPTTVPAIPAVSRGLADYLVAFSEMDHARAHAGDDAAGLVTWDKGKGDVTPDARDGFVVGGANAT